MSQSSLDAVLPYAFKKLLAAEMPDLKSSHLSEAVASGCGYPNNAALLTDLRSGAPVVLLPLEKVDRRAMSLRLAEMHGTEASAFSSRIATALDAIGARVSGGLAPAGSKSSLLTASPAAVEAAAVPSSDEDPIVTMLVKQLDIRSATDSYAWEVHRWSGRTTALIKIAVAACRSLSRSGDAYFSDLERSLSIDVLAHMMDRDAYPSIPDGVRADIQAYLSSLPGFREGAWRHARTTLDHHEHGAKLVLKAIKQCRTRLKQGVRPSKSPILLSSHVARRLLAHLHDSLSKGPIPFDDNSPDPAIHQCASRLALVIGMAVADLHASSDARTFNMLAYSRLGWLLSPGKTISSETRTNIEDYLRRLPGASEGRPFSKTALEAHAAAIELLRLSIFFVSQSNPTLVPKELRTALILPEGS